MGEYTAQMPSTAVGTLTRPTTLRIPNGWKPTKKYPLLIFLHNYDAQHGNDTQDSGGLDVRGRMDMDQCGSFDDGAFSLVPNGLTDGVADHKIWNASPACCDTNNIGTDDKGYIVQCVQNVIAAGWNVDLKRVMAIGYSNGAFLANALGCHFPTVFSHVIGVAGAFDTLDGSGCAQTKTVSVLVIHGTNDTTVPYPGGIGNPPVSQRVPVTAVCSADQTVTFWAAVNNASSGSLQAPYGTIDLVTTGTPVGTGAETSQQAWSGTAADGQLEKWPMNGVDHTMTFSTGAGQKVWAWAYSRPRLS